MAKTILLTGATGFLGSHLLEALLNAGYEVSILKRSTSDTWRIGHLPDRVKSYDADKGLIAKAFEERPIDVVVHMATLYRKFNDEQQALQMVEANINFPLRLLELAASYGVRGFINTGTFFECDCSRLPLEENAPAKPFNFYAKTKLAFESIVRMYADRMHTVTLRLFSPYGEKDNEKLIPVLIQKMLLGETVELSDGFQKLDFIYATDVVTAYVRAIEKIEEFDQGHEVFNIGSGIGISVREVVSVLEQHLGRPVAKKWGPPSSVDIPAVFADISKAKSKLGWEPKFSIHDGLVKTLEYYKRG